MAKLNGSPPDSPSPDRSASARARPGGANARLDPYGVYGTRSSNRLQLSRRKRKVQASLLGVAACLLLLLVVLAWKWVSLPRGRLVWSAALQGNPAAPPALAGNDHWLVPCTNGTLLKLAYRGPERGTATRVLSTGFPLQSTPVVYGDNAFVPSQDGNIYAINWKTGSRLWSFSSKASITGTPLLGPKIGGALTLFLGNDDGKVVCLNRADGTPLWGSMVGGPVGNSLALDVRQQRLYVPVLPGVAARGGLVCLSATTGKKLWSYPALGTVFGAGLAAPAVESRVGGPNFAYFGTEDGVFVKLPGATGEVGGGRGWKSFATPRPSTLIHGSAYLLPVELVSLRSPPVLDGGAGRVLVGGNDGGLRCFEAQTGKLLWIYATGYPIRLPVKIVTIEGKSVYLLAPDAPELLALDAAGQLYRKWRLRAQPVGFEVVGQEILVAQVDGTLDALTF